LANLIIDLSDSSGIAREKVMEKDRTGRMVLGQKAKCPTYVFYKGTHLLEYMRNLEGRDLEKAKQSFVKMAEHALRTHSIESRSLGIRMAYAYELTGDTRYLKYALNRVNDVLRTPRPAPQGVRKYATSVSQVRYALLPAIYDTYLMAALAQGPDLAREPPVPLLFKHRAAPAVEFVFVKEAGKPLTIELSASGATFTGPEGEALPAAWLGQATAYYPHNDGIQALNTDQPLLFCTVTVPASAPAGEIRVRVEHEGAAYVFAASAARMVIVAAEGFFLGRGLLITPAREVRLGNGHDDLFYFQVPRDARRFRLATGDPQRLVVTDPRGRPVRLRPLGGNQYEAVVPGDARDGPWLLRAVRCSDVALADIRPVFAYQNPQSYFAPKGVQVVHDLPVAPGTGAAKPRRPRKP
jgi:hypothetical protein